MKHDESSPLKAAREYLVEALRHARTIVAQVHPEVPWTDGGPWLQEDDIDLLVVSDTPFADPPASAPGEIERAIGRYVAAPVEDGATLEEHSQ